MQLSDRENSILNALFVKCTEDFPLIYEDFFKRNYDKEKAMALSIDYVSTDICDAIHDNILVGNYKKIDIPNLAFITYRDMNTIISEKLKSSIYSRV